MILSWDMESQSETKPLRTKMFEERSLRLMVI